MQNKNNTRFAALLITPVALLTVLAQNNTVAAPTDKVPVTAEAAQTLSYTATSYKIDEQTHDVPVSIVHVYFMRPDSVRMEYESSPLSHGYNRLVITKGNKGTRYASEQNEYSIFKINNPAPANFGLPVSPDKLEHVMYKEKPALLQTKTFPVNGNLFRIEQTCYDEQTHETILTIQSLSSNNASQKPTVKIVYTDWKLNPKLDASLFVFTPPPGSKLLFDNSNTP